MTDTIQARLAYAKLPAQDMERARRFYDEKLGLQPLDDHDPQHLFYDVAGVRFLLFQSSGAPSGTHDQMGFVVQDIKARVDELRDRGVVFEDYEQTVDGVAQFGEIRAAWFKDTEGNLLNLIEAPSAMFSS
jgi:catechol 2,3-dioxygenase-like lactoylglutathione lyase family enzyme